MDGFDTLLLKAVQQEDVTSLKTHLLTTLDPNQYVNRLYDNPNEQKSTLLMMACLSGYEDMVYMLLDCFKPNLEVLNIIQLDNDDQELEVYDEVTVLWAAAAIDNFSIVKRLVEHGANVNHTTKTNSTPLRCACSSGNIEMARYLVENSADIHINKQNNETNLALSVYRKHLKLTSYLVDELNCDVNECDTNGRSPLYFAVKCESSEIAQLLLDHRADNSSTTFDGMTPLMLAAEGRHNDLMGIIVPYCSLLESIEAEELLGSTFACAEHGPCDLSQLFEHFYRALELRLFHNLPKPVKESTNEAFNNRQECQRIDQLEELRLNPENMYTEALLVRERLLGSASETYLYSLMYRGAVLADEAQFHRTLILWMHELELRRQHSILLDMENMRRFVAIFSSMTLKSIPIPIEALLAIVTTIVEEVKHSTENIDYNLHTLLCLTTITSQPSVHELLSSNDRKAFYRLLRSVNQGRYVTCHDRFSLLSLSLKDWRPTVDIIIDGVCKYPCLYTIRTLLQCGADVNEIDGLGNTPLHIFASNSTICDKNILQLLCDAGAHLDHTNILGETPIDIASNSNTKQLLKAKMKISLKCLCARLIQKNNIPFRGMMSSSLISFVVKH